VLLRTEVPVVAVDLSVFRRQSHRRHTVFWNPLLKQLEPMACGRCGLGTFVVSFTDNDVTPLCTACAALEKKKRHEQPPASPPGP
jgi:hypothetical protein